MAEVYEVNRAEHLEPFRLLWKTLLEQTRGGSFLQSAEMLEAYWRHFGGEQRLRVLIVFSRGRPIGIVPLKVAREQTDMGHIRVLKYPLDAWAMYYGPIGPNPTASLTAAMRYLRKHQGDWDVIDLCGVNRDGPDRGRTQQAMRAAGVQGRESVWRESAAIDLSGSWDDYLAGRGAEMRKQLRCAEQSLAALGEVVYERYRPLRRAHGDDDPRSNLFDECVPLIRDSANNLSPLDANASGDAMLNYLRDVYALAAQAGALDFNVIRIDGRAAACGCNFHRDGRVQQISVGRDPQFQDEHPIDVLYAKIVRDSFERADRLFEYGNGSTASIEQWQTRVARSYHYTYYALSNPRAQLLRVKRWLVRRSTNAAAAI